MATEVLQFEKLAVVIAAEALKKAEQEFHQQLTAYQEEAKQHEQRAKDYRTKRHLVVY